MNINVESKMKLYYFVVFMTVVIVGLYYINFIIDSLIKTLLNLCFGNQIWEADINEWEWLIFEVRTKIKEILQKNNLIKFIIKSSEKFNKALLCIFYYQKFKFLNLKTINSRKFYL